METNKNRRHRNTPGARKRRKQAIRRRIILTCVAAVLMVIGAFQRYEQSAVHAVTLEDYATISTVQIPEAAPVSEEPVVVEEPTEEPAIEPEWFEIEATAYCSCVKCCDGWALNRPNGIVYTANGAVAEAGVTIAADWDVFPPGTVLYIEGLGERIVQARGGAINDYDVDVYFDNHQDALEFGRQHLQAYVVEYGE